MISTDNAAFRSEGDLVGWGSKRAWFISRYSTRFASGFVGASVAGAIVMPFMLIVDVQKINSGRQLAAAGAVWVTAFALGTVAAFWFGRKVMPHVNATTGPLHYLTTLITYWSSPKLTEDSGTTIVNDVSDDVAPREGGALTIPNRAFPGE